MELAKCICNEREKKKLLLMIFVCVRVWLVSRRDRRLLLAHSRSPPLPPLAPTRPHLLSGWTVNGSRHPEPPGPVPGSAAGSSGRLEVIRGVGTLPPSLLIGAANPACSIRTIIVLLVLMCSLFCPPPRCSSFVSVKKKVDFCFVLLSSLTKDVFVAVTCKYVLLINSYPLRPL